MREYTVHFRKGTRVGTRRYRFVTVEALNSLEATRLARQAEYIEPGFRIIRVDHFEPAENDFAGDRLVIDWES